MLDEHTRNQSIHRLPDRLGRGSRAADQGTSAGSSRNEDHREANAPARGANGRAVHQGRRTDPRDRGRVLLAGGVPPPLGPRKRPRRSPRSTCRGTGAGCRRSDGHSLGLDHRGPRGGEANRHGHRWIGPRGTHRPPLAVSRSGGAAGRSKGGEVGGSIFPMCTHQYSRRIRTNCRQDHHYEIDTSAVYDGICVENALRYGVVFRSV